LELAVDGAPIVQQCLERGLLINCTQQTVLRLLPAMTLTDEQLDEGCDILAEVLRAGSGEQGARSP
jgi:4-aminobutyrate aminotransferase-like enzyme